MPIEHSARAINSVIDSCFWIKQIKTENGNLGLQEYLVKHAMSGLNLPLRMKIEGKWTTLNSNKISKAIKKMQKNCPEVLKEILSSQYSMHSAYIFTQYCTLGAHRYE